MLKGNKGEWSELYTFLKLLSSGELYAADSQLEKVENIYYPLIEILRTEKGKELKYVYADDMITIENESEKSSIKIPIYKFKENSFMLLEKIKTAKGRSFSVNEIEDFLSHIKVSSLKSPSRDKTDIVIKVHDPYTGMTPFLGFSIKSKLGGAATLFNAGKTTNFIHKLSENMTDDLMTEVNNIENPHKYRRRMIKLEENDITLHFINVSSEMFELNLQVIDSNMPKIIANLLYYYYSGKGAILSELLQLIQDENPCNFNSEYGHFFYEYKLKSFLVDVALGMVPSVMWTGHFDATGGYIIVKENGEVLCYHIYNFNEFQEYLLNNVKFDTPSSRNDFGTIYKVDDDYFINLNLQIRFI